MVVVNLFAGPGAGKSTTAAATFALLKYSGEKVELVTEYAKDKVWEKSFGVLENQLYVFAKQHHRIFRLRNDVDYVVTDSPLLLSLYYGDVLGHHFINLVLEQHRAQPSLNVLLMRSKPYQQYGRTQSEVQAREIDQKLSVILDTWQIPYHRVVGDSRGPAEILKLLFSV